MPSNQSQSTTDYGTIENLQGRSVLRFERRLPHPPERVWDALTRPDRIAQWFGDGDIDLELVEGGKFEIRTTGPPELVDAIIAEVGEQGLVQRNTVLRVEPPKVFEHTFGDPASGVRWELVPDGGGSLLRLVHTVPPEFKMSEEGPRTLAGWHAVLERFAQVLDDKPGDWRRERWEGLREEYEARVPADTS
jgi:uncharacterized protein YndB with AHSA1/START domain